MTEYLSSRPLTSSASAAYDYLSKVSNLPRYFPRITSAELRGEEEEVTTTAVLDGEDVGSESRQVTVTGQAWFQTDHHARSITWGAEGPHDHHGSLTVAETPDGALLSITLHTTADYPGVQDSLEETLDSISDGLT